MADRDIGHTGCRVQVDERSGLGRLSYCKPARKEASKASDSLLSSVKFVPAALKVPLHPASADRLSKS
jgi:hypothetical protein